MRASLLALLLTLVLAAPVMAQVANQDGYTPEGPQAVERTSASDGPREGASSLPFTGMDLFLVGALGAGLLGVGVGMRRLTQPAGPASS